MSLKAADIYELIQGFHTTQAIYATVRLHLPEALARKRHVTQNILKRLLRFLAEMDIVTEPEAETFALAPKGEVLLTNSPQSLASFAIRSGEELYQGWSNSSIYMTILELLSCFNIPCKNILSIA